MVSAVLDLVSAPGVLYATVLVLLTIDAFIPVVPAQALMIGGGILSASGHVQLLILVLAGATGVIVGDLLAFLVGRRLARRGTRPSRMPRRAQAVTARLNDAMQRHIFLAVLFCRFVPAGRMITAVYAGRNGVSTRRFATYDVVAATLWASYGALLGHFGGEAIEDSSWLPIVLIAAAALAFVAGAPLLGLANRLRRRATTPAEPALALTASATPASEATASAAPALALAASAVTASAAPALAMAASAAPASASTGSTVPALAAAGSAVTASAAPALVMAASPASASASTGSTLPALAAAGSAVTASAATTDAATASTAPRAALVNRARRWFASAATAKDAPAFPANADATTAAPATADGATPVSPRRPGRVCRRRSVMETLAAAEPLAAIEVLVAAEAVAAAEHVVVQVNGLESATS